MKLKLYLIPYTPKFPDGLKTLNHTYMDTVKYCPDVSSVKDLLSHLLRVLPGDSLQRLVSSVTASAAKSCLMKSHTPFQGNTHPMTEEKAGTYRPGHLSPVQKVFEVPLESQGFT